MAAIGTIPASASTHAARKLVPTSIYYLLDLLGFIRFIGFIRIIRTSSGTRPPCPQRRQRMPFIFYWIYWRLLGFIGIYCHLLAFIGFIGVEKIGAPGGGLESREWKSPANLFRQPKRTPPHTHTSGPVGFSVGLASVVDHRTPCGVRALPSFWEFSSIGIPIHGNFFQGNFFH